MRRNGTALLTKVIVGIRMQEERAERNATHSDVNTAAAHADAPSFDATHVNTKRFTVTKEAAYPIATARTTRTAHVVFLAACQRWEARYGRYTKYKDAPHRIHYFTYLNYLPHQQRFIYATNRVERFNRNFKKATHGPDTGPRSACTSFAHVARGYIPIPTLAVGLGLRKCVGRGKENLGKAARVEKGRTT